MEERPEKCPIENCEYHTKGFARKYDKNRHALTHYKGTMVCPFCAGVGTAFEKAFNRADVFKRHLTAVHNVEQTPPNSRKLILTTTGRGMVEGSIRGGGAKCSICRGQFHTAQEFYEHVDDCVLNVIVPPTPKSTGGAGSGPMSGGPTSASTVTTTAGSSTRKDSGTTRTPTTASTDKGEKVREAEMDLDPFSRKPAEVGPEPELEPEPERESERHHEHDDAEHMDRYEEHGEREDDSGEPEALEVTLGSPALEDKMDTDP